MALGTGGWTSQNMVLPGTYINFTSPLTATASAGVTGVVAIPLELDWGKEGEIITVEYSDFISDSKSIFGYDILDDKMINIRELFKNASKLLVYRLGTSTKASCTYASALYGGIRGNDLKLVVTKDGDIFTVETYLDGSLVDSQDVTSSDELTDNDYVSFVKTSTLAVTTGLSLTGGANDSSITGDDYQSFLDKIESYTFNILACPSSTDTIKALFVLFTKTMCDDSGSNFQTVCYRVENADHQCVVSVENESGDSDNPEALVYWVSGALANCALGESITNKTYDGEYDADLDYTQAELKAGITAGKFMFHSVNGTAVVLKDINTFVSFTDTKGSDFASNQTVRTTMSLAVDIAAQFGSYYLGKVPNDSAGRLSLWNDVCKILSSYQSQRAIDSFETSDITISEGSERTNVICQIENLQITGAMEALYMNVVII